MNSFGTAFQSRAMAQLCQQQPVSLIPLLHRPTLVTRNLQQRCNKSVQHCGTALHALPHLKLQRASVVMQARARSRRNGDVAPLEEDLNEPAATPGGKLESMKLPTQVREATEKAVEALGCSVTVGDVAASAGLKINEAEAALNALAADCQGALQVSEAGDIRYVLPKNFRTMLKARSWLLRAQPVLKAIRSGAGYLVRVSFGTALITSVVLVWTTIVALMTAASKDDNRSDRRSHSYSYIGGSPRIFFDMSDLFYYWDPYYWKTQRQRRESGMQLSFVESIFSFVFGDGDPNERFEEERWRLIGQYIQSKGGVVTAEQLAPFLDNAPTTSRRERDSIFVDEAFVLPVLSRFEGQSEVDSNGNLFYRFPSLQTTAKVRKASPSVPAYASEARVPFSLATQGQRVGAVALGAANLVGVVVLGTMLQDRSTALMLARSGLAFVGSALPFLTAYASAFFLIPVARWFANASRNAQIEKRNEARLENLRRLAEPDLPLAKKLAAAANLSERKVVSDQDIVYRSDLGMANQSRDIEADEFDRRLAEREARQPSNWGPLPSSSAAQGNANPIPDYLNRRQREIDVDWR